MKIAVRMDDITPDMNWERFERFKALLDEYQVKPLIGVVPDNRDDNLNMGLSQASGKPHPEFWQYVRSLQQAGWTVAMHGYRHMYTTAKGGLFPLNNFSEFAGLPKEQQKQMLKEGKRLLNEHGIETDIFMAPAHSYDKNTLTALSETGFRRVTDGFGHAPYYREGIIFYPISFRLDSSLRKRHGFTTMVIHANTMSDQDMERCAGYFKNPGHSQWISFEDYIKQPAAARPLPRHWAEWWCAWLKRLLQWGRSVVRNGK